MTAEDIATAAVIAQALVVVLSATVVTCVLVAALLKWAENGY